MQLEKLDERPKVKGLLLVITQPGPHRWCDDIFTDSQGDRYLKRHKAHMGHDLPYECEWFRILGDS